MTPTEMIREVAIEAIRQGARVVEYGEKNATIAFGLRGVAQVNFDFEDPSATIKFERVDFPQSASAFVAEAKRRLSE